MNNACENKSNKIKFPTLMACGKIVEKCNNLSSECQSEIIPRWVTVKKNLTFMACCEKYDKYNSLSFKLYS